jgi:hypothetical protein
MTVLTIRAHKRYAVRHPVRLGAPGSAATPGLLIELSAEGCRISKLAEAMFEAGERIVVHLGQVALPGRIRWAHDGLAGIRLDNVLRRDQFAELVALARGEIAGGEVSSTSALGDQRRYGT